MARIIGTGFEMGSTSPFAAPLGTILSAGTLQTGATAAGFSGTYYWQNGQGRWIVPAASTYYTKQHISITGFSNRIVQFYGNGQANSLGHLELDSSTRKLQYTATATTVVGTMTLDINVVYRIEVKIIKGASSNGTLQVKVNGVLDVNRTSFTTVATDYNIDGIAFGYNNTKMDDCVVDDATWVGNTRFQGLVGNGLGNYTQWDMSGTGGNNYERVDDVPILTGGSDDYIYTNVVNELDSYAMSNLSEGSNPIDSVASAIVWAKVRQEGSATPQNVQLGLRYSGTDSLSASKAVQQAADYHMVYHITETAPGGGSLSKTIIDASECIIKSIA
jgi:hypothetical protein